MSEQQQSKGGRPAHKPTFEQRELVLAMAIGHASKRAIARALGIDTDTLCKHYPEEIEDGYEIFEGKLLASMMRQAFGAPAEFDAEGNQIRAEQKAVPVIGIFMSKVHLGWNESSPMKLQQPALPREPKEPKLGKKEQAAAAAATAGVDSDWGSDLTPGGNRHN